MPVFMVDQTDPFLSFVVVLEEWTYITVTILLITGTLILLVILVIFSHEIIVLYVIMWHFHPPPPTHTPFLSQSELETC